MNKQLTFQADKQLWPVREIDALTSRVTEVLANDERPDDALLADLGRGMRQATAEEISDAMIVLHGLYGGRGDPEIVATVGVDLIEAEAAPIIAIQSAFLALLRPMPPVKCPATGLDAEPIKPRRFIPTISEILYEVGKQAERWATMSGQIEYLADDEHDERDDPIPY